MSRTFFSTDITGAELMEASPATVKTIARDAKITVTHSGDDAYSRQGQINLPVYDATAVFKPSEVAANRGYLDHEVGHELRSDLEHWDRWAESNKGATEEVLLTQLGNIIEDVRNDLVGCRDEVYGQSYQMHMAALEQTHKAKFIKELTGDEKFDDVKAALPFAIQLYGYKRLGAYEHNFPDLPDNLFDELDKKIPQAIKDMANSAVDLIEKMNDGKSGTKEATDLADQLVATIRKERGEEGTGREGGGKGDGKGDGKGKGAKSGNGKGKTNGDTPGVGAGNGQELNVDKSISNLMEHHVKPHKGGFRYRPLSVDFDQVIGEGEVKAVTSLGAHMQKRFRSATPSDYHDIRTEIGGTIGVVKSKLERALMTRMEVDWSTGRRHGKLDRRLLHTVPTGNVNVFKRPDGGRAIDTAVAMLIDGSGSMSGSRIHRASRVAICLAEALDRAGVPFEVTGFNNCYPESKEWERMYRDAADKGELWERTSALVFYVFKGFGESLIKAKPKLATIAKMTGGDNGDGDALMRASRRLLKRRESRKVMLVLSDGQPITSGMNVSSNVHAQYLRNVVDRCKKDGIDMVGIGIQSDCVKKFYDKHVVLNNIDDLPFKVMGLVGSLLLGMKQDNPDLWKAIA
jgi:cobaltochelatase CobT